MNPADVVKERLQALLPSLLSVQDESHLHVGHAGAVAGVHLCLQIVSDQFVGLPLLARHRLVYKTIGDLVAIGVHAVGMVTMTLSEYAVHHEKEIL